MKYSKEFTITPGMNFTQIAALEKAANQYFDQVAELGQAQKFVRCSSMVVVHEVAVYGEITTEQSETGMMDSKGRKIGFVAVYRDNGEDFRCYVQSTRDGKEFGVPQRSKSFKSAAQAKIYGAGEVAKRVAKAKA